MKSLVFFLAFVLEGAVLAFSGFTFLTWQYWAITALTGVAAIALAWRDV